MVFVYQVTRHFRPKSLVHQDAEMGLESLDSDSNPIYLRLESRTVGLGLNLRPARLGLVKRWTRCISAKMVWPMKLVLISPDVSALVQKCLMDILAHVRKYL